MAVEEVDATPEDAVAVGALCCCASSTSSLVLVNFF